MSASIAVMLTRGGDVAMTRVQALRRKLGGLVLGPGGQRILWAKIKADVNEHSTSRTSAADYLHLLSFLHYLTLHRLLYRDLYL